MRYSVLMSVYHKEKPEYLREAMNSMWVQTIPTDDFVLVCDGPLTEALNGVVEGMRVHPELTVVRLEKNQGLGIALNEGLKRCQNELVARMDSDDISRPDRCERQLSVFKDRPDVAIVSGVVEEFSESINAVAGRRVPPETQEAIMAFAKRRNPFNHPCVMYKKSVVEAAGGYQDLFLLEDYYLWVRMLQKGFVGRNLPEPLLWMRAGPGLYQRRAGWKYVRSQEALFRYMKKTKFINNWQYLSSVMLRGLLSLMPPKLREFTFHQLARA